MIINSVNGGGVPQLPEQVETLTLLPGNLSAILTWAEPQQDQDESFVGTRIVRKIGSCPQNPHDGDVVYEGVEFTYTDEGLAENVTYYYRAFAYNEKKKYQNSMRHVSTTASTTFPLSLLPEGSLININENNVAVPFCVAKHNYETNLNGAGRTLLVRKNIIDEMPWGEYAASYQEAGIYAECDIDAWLNDDYCNLLDGSIQELLGTSFYSMGAETELSDSQNTIITDSMWRKIFILSARELGVTKSSFSAGDWTYYYAVEGSTVPIANTLINATDESGTAAPQWTRSRAYGRLSTSQYFKGSAIEITKNGVVNFTVVENSRGVRPAFTLPAEKRVQLTIDDDGCYNFA